MKSTVAAARDAVMRRLVVTHAMAEEKFRTGESNLPFFSVMVRNHSAGAVEMEIRDVTIDTICNTNQKQQILYMIM